MEHEHGTFAVKLCELEREYDQLKIRIRQLQRESPERLRQERERIQSEYHEHDVLLDKTVRYCRSPEMAKMAELQLNFGRQAEEFLRNSLDSEEKQFADRWDQSRAETTALYAEFAIDFATQAMRYALISAIRAMELQIKSDLHMEKGDINFDE